jgi:hypothetical protein
MRKRGWSELAGEVVVVGLVANAASRSVPIVAWVFASNMSPHRFVNSATRPFHIVSNARGLDDSAQAQLLGRSTLLPRMTVHYHCKISLSQRRPALP